MGEQQVSNTTKLIKGMSSQTIVTIVLGVMEMVSFSIMSRLLTKTDFGYFSALTAITIIFSSLTQTGVGAAIIQKKNLTESYANNAFSINLIVGLFVSALLFVLSGPIANIVLDDTMVKPLRLMSITLLCSCLTSPASALLSRDMKFLHIGGINLLSLVVSTTVAAILAIKGFSYYAIISKHIVASVLTLIMMYIVSHPHFKWSFNKNEFKSIFNFSGWLMASTIVAELAHQVESFMLPKLISVNALGAYSRPKSFVNQISAKFNSIFDMAMFPILSSIQDDKDRVATAFSKSLYYMNIVSMFLSLAFLFNSELLIRIFFGEEWLDLKYIMMIVSINVIINADGRLADINLRSLAMTRQQFIFRVIELFVASGSLIIGYQLGLIGVAIATTASNLILKFIKVFYVSNKISIAFKPFLKTLLSSWRFVLFFVPPMLVATYFTESNWMGNIIVAVVFVLVFGLVFMVFPQCVGNQYKDEAFKQVVLFVRNKIKRK